MNKLSLTLLPVILLAGGCQTTLEKVGYVSKDKLERQIEQVRVANQKNLENKEREIKTALGEVIKGKDAQIQEAANSLHGATLTRPYFKEESRPLMIVFNRVDEAKSALGVGPTLEAMRAEQDRLVRELDETLTSIEQLKSNHEAVVKKNTELVIETESQLARVAELEKEKEKIKQEGIDKLLLKQDELNKLNDKLIAAEKQNSEDKKYVEANKTRISIGAGLLAVACLMGAIFSPVFKDKLSIGAGVFGAISIGIIFLQPWHVGVFFGAALLIGGFFILRKTSIMNKVNENLVNALQEVKDSKPELYKTEIKPVLSEWNTKYDKDGGKVEDKKAVGLIEEILKDYERK